MTPAKKKGTGRNKPPPCPPAPKPEIVIVTEQPTKITQTVVPPASPKRKVWDAVAAIRQALFYGMGIGIGLTPIGSHIISQFYCGHGENMRCNPIEFPAWMEFAGIIIAMAFANAAKDVVSKSFGQLFEAAKALPALMRRDPPPPAQ